MSIETTYKSILLEEYIKEQLKQGESVSVTDLDSQIDILDALKLDKPIFNFEDASVVNEYEVTFSEEASASKFNNTFDVVRQDLNVLYKETVNLSKNALETYERWKQKAESIEKELIDIEEEVENLLLLSQDTEGYHSTIVDNFTDLFSVELGAQTPPVTDAKINLKTGQVTLAPDTAFTTQIFLDDLHINDVTFKVRSSISSRSDLPGTDLTNIFRDTSMVWHTVLETEQAKPIVCDLIIKLVRETQDPVTLNRIEAILHDSGHSGTMNITPLYSIDNITYNLLPIDDFSQNVVGSSSFYFKSIEAKYIKFILSKSSPDPSSSEIFKYQFGFKRIGFFSESYSVTNKQVVESKWLSALDEDEVIKQFEKLTLEVCEIIPKDTSINYYIATTSEDISTPPTPTWYPASPVNREENLDSLVFEIGSTSSETISDMVHYDTSTSNAICKYLDSSSLMQDLNLTDEDELYTHLNPDSDSILNYLLYNETGQAGKSPLEVNDFSLILYRDVGKWRFKDPYYYSVVEVKNAVGLELTTGEQTITIDDSEEKRGTVTIPQGIHLLRIHKHSHNEDSDSLKTLIGDGTGTGVDFLAARKMEKVSIFDILNNVISTNFDKFAMDLSLPGKINSDKTVKKVFLVKKDPDNTTEKFKVKFNLINKLRKHVKVKAELGTEESTITPSLDGYQIKLA